MNSDGEYFVDVPKNPIPPADTWNELSVNQLIDVKNSMTTRMFQYHNHPAMLKPLQAAIAKLDALISQRLSAN
jgi:hypothetical protein